MAGVGAAQKERAEIRRCWATIHHHARLSGKALRPRWIAQRDQFGVVDNRDVLTGRGGRKRQHAGAYP